MRVFLILLSLCQLSTSYNYLVFCPLFGHSHTTYFAKIADTLTEAGHNVTFFTPTIIRKFAKIDYVKSTKNVIHLEPSQLLERYGNSLEDQDILRFWTDDSSMSEIFPMIELFNKMFLEQSNVLGENLDLLEELKAMNFDVMIYESFVESAYTLLDYLEIKAFIPSTSITYDPNLLESIGEPRMPSAVPLPMSKFSDKMTLMQRFVNTIAPPIFNLLLSKYEFKSFRPPYSIIDIPSQESLSSFIFTNSNPYLDYPRPKIEKNVQIGGISVDVEKLRSQKVKEEWDAILNLRPKTVLVSFGSIMHSKDMPFENKKTLANSMKKFPDATFIWKYESNDTDSFAKGTENIHFSKWIPQTALLADSRLTAFFTHAGLGSVNEVSYLGKPAILCPLFADQMRNAKMLARHNGSIEISKYELADIGKVTEVFRRILFDHSYAENSQKLAEQLENQPIKPKEFMVKHAEFAARFGRLTSLDPHSRNMSFAQYFLIDTFFTPTVIRKYAKINFVRSTKNVIHLEPNAQLEEIGDSLDKQDFKRFWEVDSSLSEMFPLVERFNRMLLELSNVLRENMELLDELKSMKFDAMIFESCVESAYPLLDYLQIKAFIPSTTITYDPNLLESIGEPRMPSAVPMPMSKFTDKMSLMDRFANSMAPPIFNLFLSKIVFKSFRAPYSTIDIPSQVSRSSFVFTNSNPYLDYPRPTLERTVQIGGISVDVEKLRSQKVNEEWDAILNLRPKTVLVSFGSLMFSKDMPIEYKKALAITMEKFPDVTFIWKYESDDMDLFAEGVPNIHFSKWVPQTALLADKRLSAFFTHAGMGSINEVCYLGKPVIVSPLLADQMRNAKMLTRHNGSIEISKYELSDSKKIESVLRQVLYDESYRIASEGLSHQLENQPIKPKELLVRYAEFAAQFGYVQSLDPYSRHMSFVEYFLLDIATILLFSLWLFSFIIFQITKRLFHCLPFTLSSDKQKTN